MIRRPPRSTRTDTLFPYTTLFRSLDVLSCHTLRRAVDDQISRSEQGVERPYDLDASSAHRLGVFVRGAIQGEALLRCHSGPPIGADIRRSEEHTSELQSLMRNSYAVFCLTKKKHTPIEIY